MGERPGAGGPEDCSPWLHRSAPRPLAGIALACAAEAGLAWSRGPLAIGLPGQVVHATSRSPVTEPDTLRTIIAGADLRVAWTGDLFGGR